MEKQVYDIWLSLCLTPGTETYATLKRHFSDSEAVFFAEPSSLSKVLGSKTKDYEKLTDKDLGKAKEVYKFCKKFNVGILAYDDENFPDSLRKIPTPPVLLYYRGRLPDFKSSFCVSVVGTRSLSKYGRKNAFNIAHDLAKAGATVVSGMALGIDGVASAGAVSAGGVTVAVIGSGIDVCYPLQHINLAREIVKNGCIFTEYAPGTKPNGYNFPKRNRIISGLSEATLVIEGSERSGALITARHAKEQGRAVYALPGNVESRNSEVSNLLLKNGAKICTSADDIVRDFEKEARGILNPFGLGTERRPDMFEVLSKYCVSATSAEDDIFTSRPKSRNNSAANGENGVLIAEQAPMLRVAQKKDERECVNFDERTLKLYKKIPREESVLIESLVDDENSLRDVMKCLLKLEMGRFVKMLPGERVSRNL